MRRKDIVTKLKQKAPLSGLKNCHTVGLDSTVLDIRPDGSLSRIFYAGPECGMDRVFGPDGYMVVGAHNHDKPIWFTTLVGVQWHIRLRMAGGVMSDSKWYRYPFKSALGGGQFGLGKPKAFRGHLTIQPLDDTHMDVLQTHSVLASRDSAWHCDEGPQAHGTKKYIWSPRKDLTLDATGLYIPMTYRELKWTREMLIHKAGG